MATGASTEREAALQPYMGAYSYGPEDAELFFGREEESEHVTRMVLAHRVSFLYAASGAGKSSMLAARVAPALEARGWIPIELRLNDLLSKRQL